MPAAPSSASGARHPHTAGAKLTSSSALATAGPSSSGATASSSSAPLKASMSTINAIRHTTMATQRLRRSMERNALRLHALEAEYLPMAAGLALLRGRAAMVDQHTSCSSKALSASNGSSSNGAAVGTTLTPHQTNAPMRHRNYVTNPLLSTELEYLINSGSNSGGGGSSSGQITSPTASTPTVTTSTGGLRTYHGWSVIGVEAVTSSSACNTYKNNIVADPCRWVSLSYGPSTALMDDARTRQQLSSRVGVAADGTVAKALELLKRGETAGVADMIAAGGEGAASKKADGAAAEDGTIATDPEVSYIHPMCYIRADM